jgi:hypothetical protein
MLMAFRIYIPRATATSHNPRMALGYAASRPALPAGVGGVAVVDVVDFDRNLFPQPPRSVDY